MKNNQRKLFPSNQQSLFSGGTSDILPTERKKATFEVNDMINFLNGGETATKRRKFIESAISKDTYEKCDLTRKELLKTQVRDFIDIHKKYANFKPTRQDICTMAESSIGFSSIGNSHNWFLATIMGQGSIEQQQFWIQKILKFEIVGSYAQTELGHGSNVRGLNTTAVYDKNEFILNTPTLQSIKWWPGALGRVCTHVVLYAQLIIDGKEFGVHVFLMQIRDENHKPMDGIKIGDLGNKMGDNANDTGYMILENVRIPREAMLAKYHKVDEHGKFVTVLKANPQVHYTTMNATRSQMVNTSGSRLAQAATIAIRYSCIRKQGFKSFDNSVSYKSEEIAIVDHQIQQYRLYKNLSLAYGIKLMGKWMMELINKIEGGEWGQIKTTDGLKEIASTSAGMKSLCTFIATNGIEDLRKCCGGNGYLLNSGISMIFSDFVWQVTAEGDMSILALLSGKSLYQVVSDVMKGNKVEGVYSYFNIINRLNSQKPNLLENQSDFKNLSYLLALFRYRSLKKNLDTYDSVNSLVKQGISLQSAFEECANQLIQATYSHCYFLIVENFVNKINSTENNKIKAVLSQICNLMACCLINDDNWGDILTNKQFRYVKTTINSLLRDIRPNCIALVDSFDYPDYVLKSTIGKYDGNIYEALYEAGQNSVLNRREVFDGYEEYLKPHLDLNYLKEGNSKANIKF